MTLLHRRIATLALLALFLTSSVMAVTPTSEIIDSTILQNDLHQRDAIAEALLDVSIPYVDNHYGSADGIIDPKEYSVEYTDSVTGITVYIEHNGTVLFVGLSAPTSGWIAFGWQNYTDDFNSEGLNGSDLIFGYAPGEPSATVTRVTGIEAVTVHYLLNTRNGTFQEEGDFPNDESTTPIQDDSLLQGYKDEVIGMRVGEERHFILPAGEAYNQVDHPMYGEDLEYIITLTRIGEDRYNPADDSEIVYSDEHGISTFQHMPDDDQDRVLAADGSDDGTRTQLEYFIAMESSDPDDIPLESMTDLEYPLMVMFGATEDISELPVQHTDWANPVMADFIPNEAPTIVVESHEEDGILEWIAPFVVDATDDIYVRRVFCKIDDTDWVEMNYDFKPDRWDVTLDLSTYEEGPHVAWFNATDISNVTGLTSLSFSIDRPYIPLMGMRVDVSRTIFTELFHNTRVEDTFSIRNNGSAPIGAIEMFLPSQYEVNFNLITARDQNGIQLNVVRLANVNDMMHWRVYFAEQIGFDETYSVTTTMSFHSLHWVSDFDDNVYAMEFLSYPVVPYVIGEATLTSIDFRSGDSLNGANPADTATNLNPMTVKEFSLSIKSFTPLIVGHRTTEITVDPWGWMLYEETVYIENIGPAKETLLLFTVPAYSVGLRVYDEVGILAASMPGYYAWNESVNVQINLRTDRFGNEGFWPGYDYTFNVEYSIRAAGHQSSVAQGSLLEIPMATMGDMVIVEHIVNVIIPNSINVVSLTEGYRLLHGVFDTTYRFIKYNGTVSNPPAVSLTYTVSLGAISRPMIFAAIVGLIALAYVALRKVEVTIDALPIGEGDASTSEARSAGAPPELLRKFATLYSRKTTLNIDLEKLDASRRRGKVKKREYMIRERDIKTQIDQLDSELPSVREELLSYGPRYRDWIGQLELENEKIEGAKAGLRQLLRRKKKQQISRAAFEKIRQDYLKTIKKATSTTDRILLSLQEEAGDI
ncbi:MAG: FKBP-type peptidyl-prolyl cis-trans isomerase [Candidatus Thorarchaeota archaeon]